MMDLQDAYAEYIIVNAPGDRLICNGDGLVEAMEDGYLWEEFGESVGLTEDEIERGW